jgi:predicted site-specific integrase-resolvase
MARRKRVSLRFLFRDGDFFSDLALENPGETEQQASRSTPKDCARLLAFKYELSSEDSEFLEKNIREGDGLCPLSSLVRYLKRSSSTLYKLFSDGLLEGAVKGGRILITSEDAARLIAFERLWIPVSRAAKEIHVSPKTLRRWALKGYLGSFFYDFRERLLVKRAILPAIEEEKEEIRRLSFRETHRPRSYLKVGEIGVPDIAEAFEIPRSTVLSWLKTGNLRGFKRGRYWVITGPPELVEWVLEKKAKASGVFL